MKRTRRNHSPEFKAKIAFAALSGRQTVAQVGELTMELNWLPGSAHFFLIVTRVVLDILPVASTARIFTALRPDLSGAL